jgi:hypothetical protein
MWSLLLLLLWLQGLLETQGVDSCASFFSLPGPNKPQYDVAYALIPGWKAWSSSVCAGQVHHDSTYPLRIDTAVSGAFLCTKIAYGWLGLSRDNTSAAFKWVDGDINITSISWRANYPSNTSGNNCGELSCHSDSYGKIYDGNCSKVQSQACQVNRKLTLQLSVLTRRL